MDNVADNNSSYPTIRDELHASIDRLFSSLHSWLHCKAIIEDADGIKDFIKYVNRYTASELQFMLEEHGLKSEIDKMVDRIEENYDSSPTTVKEDEEETNGFYFDDEEFVPNPFKKK